MLHSALHDGGRGLHGGHGLLDPRVRDLEDLVPTAVVGERGWIETAVFLHSIPELVARIVGHPRATLENRELGEGHDLHRFGSDVDPVSGIAAGATAIAGFVPLDGVAVIRSLDVFQGPVRANDVGAAVGRTHEARGRNGGMGGGLRGRQFDLREHRSADQGDDAENEDALDAVHFIPS